MNKYLEMVNENITNDERKFRQFMAIVNIYAPESEVDAISVECTPKGNYKVLNSEGKKICLISNNCVDIETLKNSGVKIIDIE